MGSRRQFLTTAFRWVAAGCSMLAPVPALIAIVTFYALVSYRITAA